MCIHSPLGYFCIVFQEGALHLAKEWVQIFRVKGQRETLPILKLDYIFFLLSFKSSFNIFGYSPLSDIHFTNVFYQSGFVFSLTTGSFTEQKFSILTESILPIFFLLWIMLLVLHLKTHCQTQGHLDILCVI